MIICIDYKGRGTWAAWEKGKRNVLCVCGNPLRLGVLMMKKYPGADIQPSEAVLWLSTEGFDTYIDSSLHRHDLKGS